jgi:SOS-response transcriptional repressor LexA
MTPREQQIVDFISAYWAENWTSPTAREIGKAVGLASSASVHKQLLNMTRKGILERKALSKHRVLYRVVFAAADRLRLDHSDYYELARIPEPRGER